MSLKSLALGAIALGMFTSGAVALAADADDQAVAAAEHQWLKSQQTNNVELLAPLLDDKVVETNEEGKLIVGKNAVVAEAKATVWKSAEYTDEKVTVFDHTAIATGTFTGKGTAAGKPIDARTRYTDTWVKMANGKWQCVATHETAVKM